MLHSGEACGGENGGEAGEKMARSFWRWGGVRGDGDGALCGVWWRADCVPYNFELGLNGVG